MDLRSYAGTESRSNNQDTSKSENFEPNKADKQSGGMSESDVKRAINHFSKMSNDQLMRELAKHITAQKAQGKSDSMGKTIERIRPMLNSEQQKKLEEVLRQVNFK